MSLNSMMRLQRVQHASSNQQDLLVIECMKCQAGLKVATVQPRKPIVHFGNKIWAPALAAKHDVQLPVERLINISTFDLVLMRWVEVK